MKHFTITVIAGLVLVVTQGAMAKETGKKTRPPVAPPAPALNEDAGKESFDRIGLGLASINGVGGGTTALSGWIDLKNSLSVQPILAITSTSPFSFGVGGFVRKTVKGNQNAGLHLGGGLHLGTVSVPEVGLGGVTNSAKFYVAFAPIGGFHFLFPGTTNIGISFDGGVTFSITDGDFDMAANSLSSLLGLSVHYFF